MIPAAYEDVPAPSEIRPKDNDSMYNKRLHKWAHGKRTRRYMRIYEVTTGNHKGLLLIGLMADSGWFFGARFPSVLSPIHRTWTYSPGHFGGKVKDVTKDFWKRYLKIGVCALPFPRHDYKTVSKKVRVCQRCNDKQVMRIETVKKETWVSAKAV